MKGVNGRIQYGELLQEESDEDEEAMNELSGNVPARWRVNGVCEMMLMVQKERMRISVRNVLGSSPRRTMVI